MKIIVVVILCALGASPSTPKRPPVERPPVDRLAAAMERLTLPHVPTVIKAIEEIETFGLRATVALPKLEQISKESEEEAIRKRARIAVQNLRNLLIQQEKDRKVADERERKVEMERMREMERARVAALEKERLATERARLEREAAVAREKEAEAKLRETELAEAREREARIDALAAMEKRHSVVEAERRRLAELASAEKIKAYEAFAAAERHRLAELASAEKIKAYEAFAAAEHRRKHEDIARLSKESNQQNQNQDSNRLIGQDLVAAAGEFVIFLVILTVSLVFYFLPSTIAFFRGHHDIVPIFFVNLLLGWSFLGWVAALAWSLESSASNTIVINSITASIPKQTAAIPATKVAGWVPPEN